MLIVLTIENFHGFNGPGFDLLGGGLGRGGHFSALLTHPGSHSLVVKDCFCRPINNFKTFLFNPVT